MADSVSAASPQYLKDGNLQDFTRYFENLHSLNLSSAKFDVADIETLAEIIKFTQPTQIDYSFCQITSTGTGSATGISKIIEILPSSLVSLNLMGVGLNSTLMRVLTLKITELPNLRVLNLSQNPLRNPHIALLADALTVHKSIKELYLAKLFISDDAFVSVEKIIRLGLEKLDLGWGVFVGQGFNLLLPALTSRNCRLNYLGLSFCNISNENSLSLSSFILTNKSLDTLDIRFTDIPKDDKLTNSCLSNTTLTYYIRNFNTEMAMNEFRRALKLNRRLLHPLEYGDKVYYVNGNMPSIELMTDLENNFGFVERLDGLVRKLQVFSKFVRLLKLPLEIKEMIIGFGIDEEFEIDKKVLIKYLAGEGVFVDTAKELIRVAYYLHGPA